MPGYRLDQAEKTTKLISVRKRSIREWLRDVWAAVTGRTFVTMRGFCPNCMSSFYVECYHQGLFPVVSEAFNHETLEKIESPRFDMLCFNGANFYPRLSKKLDKIIYEGYWYGSAAAYERQKLRDNE
jgi:hypothetical protein